MTKADLTKVPRVEIPHKEKSSPEEGFKSAMDELMDYTTKIVTEI